MKNQKLKKETVKLACFAVGCLIVSGCLFFFNSSEIGEMFSYLLGGMFILSLVGMGIMFFEYKKYLDVCNELYYVGDNAAYRAKKLYEMRAVDIYIMFAPEEELQRFNCVFSSMKPSDYFYGEMSYLINKINNQLR